MQFSDTSTKTGLVEDIDFLCVTDSTSYPLVDKARNMNRWYYKAVVAAWEASADWEFDDSNQSNFPIATTDLVASQEDYTIPTNALKILRVEVKDNSGNWSVVQPIDDRQVNIALSEFHETDGLPIYYRMLRRNIVLYPAPASANVTLTAGLRVYFLREVDEFVSTDTTQEPGLPEPFHRILSLGPSYDWLLVNGAPEKSQSVRAEVEQLMNELKKFFSTRHVNRPAKLRPRMENYA